MNLKKKCPVCGQRLKEIEGIYNSYMTCLNCGYDETMTEREIKKLKEKRKVKKCPKCGKQMHKVLRIYTCAEYYVCSHCQYNEEII